jgi:regulator of sigma E protease
MMDLVTFVSHYVFWFLLVLSIVVFVHEFGHFIVARLCGVKVEVFSIGFGKELFGFNDRYGTRWKISLLPLGGYVQMFGDGDASSTPDPDVQKTMNAEDRKVAFFAKSIPQRAAIVAAGPAMNYLFAVIVLAGLFMTSGQPTTPPVVGGLVAGGAAEIAGLQKGDRILSLDGEKVSRFQDIQQRIALNVGTPVRVEGIRAGAPFTLTVQPELSSFKDRFGNQQRVARLGVSSDTPEYTQHPPLTAVYLAAVETIEITKSSLRAVGQIIVGARPADELGGPLRIAQMSGDVASVSLVSLIWFIGLISVSLGMINLFPVPMLDGGHLLFYAFEALLRRPLGEKVQEFGAKIGMALVGSLMIFATWNDLTQPRVLNFFKNLFS